MSLLLLIHVGGTALREKNLN